MMVIDAFPLNGNAPCGFTTNMKASRFIRIIAASAGGARL